MPKQISLEFFFAAVLLAFLALSAAGDALGQVQLLLAVAMAAAGVVLRSGTTQARLVGLGVAGCTTAWGVLAVLAWQTYIPGMIICIGALIHLAGSGAYFHPRGADPFAAFAGNGPAHPQAPFAAGVPGQPQAPFAAGAPGFAHGFTQAAFTASAQPTGPAPAAPPTGLPTPGNHLPGQGSPGQPWPAPGNAPSANPFHDFYGHGPTGAGPTR